MAKYKQRLKRNLKLYSWLKLFSSVYFHVPVWVAFELRYLTFSQLTTIEGIIMASQLVLELPTGAFADLVGRRISMTLGYLTKASTMLLYAFANNFSLFLIYALLFGLGEALISGSEEALLYDNLKELGREKYFSKFYSKMGVIVQISVSIATFIGGVMNSFYFRLPMITYAFGLFLAALVSFSLQEPRLDTEKFTLKNYLQKTKDGTKELFKNPHIKRVSWFYILVGFISWANMLVFKTTYLVELGYSEFELSIVLSVIRIFNSLFLFKVLNVGRFFNRQRTYLFFPILMIASFLPGIWLTKWIALPFVAGAMISSSARWIILGKYTNKEFDSRHRATAISALSMFVGIGYIVTVFLSGPIIEHFGGTKYMFTFLGVLSAIFVLPLGLSLAKNHKGRKS